jgi:peptidoglycan/LPS O-acetylase OafA/YrhL
MPRHIFLLVIALSTDVGPVAYFLKTKLPQTLGRLSYSLYLMHMPLLLIFGNRLERSSGILFIDWLSAFLICLVLTAEITFRFIETPGKKFILDKFSNSKIISKNQSDDTLKTDHAS